MAAAAGKKRTTSSSLFMDAFGLEVEEELSTTATQTWAEGVWVGKWSTEQKEAWRKQIFEVQSWRQVREHTSGHETCLPKRREEHAHESSEINLLGGSGQRSMRMMS